MVTSDLQTVVSLNGHSSAENKAVQFTVIDSRSGDVSISQHS